MANLKEIRTRITSVNSTRKITSAMKMVAAAKLRKAQDAITQMRPYADKLHEILDHVMSSAENFEDNAYTQERNAEKVLIIVIASNKGLCGAFNANSVKKAEELIKNEYQKLFEQGKIDIYTLGKTINETFKAKHVNVKESHSDIYNDLNFKTVSGLAEKVMKQFAAKEYDRVHIVYNKFKNAAVQIPQAEQFLPIKLSENEESFEGDYIYEPAKDQIVEQLIPYALKIQLYKAVLDSYAAEHGARMTAMHKATDNATELLKELKLTYNKARQAAITNEILEIVGGAEALNN
ncbi:MAG: ATP synthase F1 subunit gamma [Bacteroidales bacterium]|nr:ATP synthase F1 subunit gamma [Bacteroidales bacterium]